MGGNLKPNQSQSGATEFRSLQRSLMLAVMALICLVCVPLHSQLITGDVLGTVSDPHGAVVPDANVSVRTWARRRPARTKTNANGDYAISLLPPGHYGISVEAPGFKKYDVADITLAAGDRARIDATLDLGAANETVEVESAAPASNRQFFSWQSDSGETVEDIPLNGRNLTNLVTQQPGVNGGMPGNITQGVRPDDRRQLPRSPRMGRKNTSTATRSTALIIMSVSMAWAASSLPSMRFSRSPWRPTTSRPRKVVRQAR